jgi:hypothetical protein
MPFWVSESNTDGTINVATERLLVPAPTFPDYGEDRFPYTVQETEGGSSVVQRAKKNPKEMRWVWEKYNPSVALADYNNQYWWFFRQQAHIRIAEGKSPYMYLKEDVTLNFGTWDSGTGRLIGAYIKVLINYVGRTVDREGGNVRYPETEVRFVIADDTITDQY